MGPKVFLLCWLALQAGCTTTSSPAGTTAGYSATQLSRNVFTVRLAAKARAPKDQATELCLLRCAEVTLAYGFSYFVVLKNDGDRAGETSLTTPSRVPTPDGSSGSSFLDSDAGVPSSVNTIACFRAQPSGYPDLNDAAAVFDRLAGKHGVRKRLEARTNPLDASPLQFSLFPSYLLLARTSPGQIAFLEPDTARKTIVIGVLNDWENPCATIEEFKRKAAVTAAILGAQAVQIQNESSPPRMAGSGDRSRFAASLLLVPSARLGLQDEGGNWTGQELVVRGFDKGSRAPSAGLKVGDRIVELNGVNVQKQKRLADCWLSWSVGDTVVVTFVRDGRQMSLQAPTIAN